MTIDAGTFNERLYDAFWGACPDFSRYNPGARHRRRIAAGLLAGLPAGRLLDVGCGDGALLAELRRRAPHLAPLAGADLSSETVRQNRDKLPGVAFHVLDIAREALDERFDVVVCSEVVEHLDDRRTALHNLASMVEPGGHLLVTCPTGRVYETERRFGHTTHPTLDEMREHGRALGLTLERAENWGFPLYKALKWATNVNVEWAMKNFASGRYTPSAKAVSSALYWANYLNLPSSPAGCQLFVLFRR